MSRDRREKKQEEIQQCTVCKRIYWNGRWWTNFAWFKDKILRTEPLKVICNDCRVVPAVLPKAMVTPTVTVESKNVECRRCGECCMEAPCLATPTGLGFDFDQMKTQHQHKKGCGFLRKKPDGKWACGLYEDAVGEAKERLKDRLAIGCGCHRKVLYAKKENS